MDKILTGEGFAEFVCTKCNEPMDAQHLEDELMQVCNEPFNGTIMECSNDECDAEFNVQIGIRIEQM